MVASAWYEEFQRWWHEKDEAGEQELYINAIQVPSLLDRFKPAVAV